MLSLYLAAALAQPPSTAQPGPADELAAFDPSPAHPFGRRHPDAPPELAQFEFMLGEFDCVDEIRGRDGQWRRTAAIWNARYFLDGHGIEDVYWNDTFATSNVRLFDPARGKWYVNFFRSPTGRVGAGVWEGEQHDSEKTRKMVMWSGSPDRQNGSRLTFFDIGDDGFEWRAESVRGGVATPTWTSSCRRRKPSRVANAPRFLGNDASTARPFGRRAAGAPAGLDALAFQVGHFAEGAAAAPTGLRTGSWFLNGWGLRTRVYRGTASETWIHLLDTTTGRWRTTLYRMPVYEWSVFDGAFDDGRLEAVESLRNGAAPDAPRRLRIEATARGYRLELAAPGSDSSKSIECQRR